MHPLCLLHCSVRNLQISFQKGRWKWKKKKNCRQYSSGPFVLHILIWQNDFSGYAGDGSQHGDIYYRWRTLHDGVWEIPSACSVLRWNGMGCRSHGAHALVVSWAIHTRGVERLPGEREPPFKCCLCWHAVRCLCLGLCFRQIWTEVRVSWYKRKRSHNLVVNWTFLTLSLS